MAPMDAQKAVQGVVRDYCSGIEQVLQTGRSIVLSGGVGTGKTHLLAGIVRHVCEKGGTALYTTAADLVGRIRATYHRDASETEQSVLDEFYTVDLLAIDEVGRQLDTTHETVQLFRVLDRRYAERKPVVLASNMDRDALTTHLGAALTDRLREAGGQLLALDWGSQRSRRRNTD